jgi:CBS-domain-containing membrane protein
MAVAGPESSSQVAALCRCLKQAASDVYVTDASGRLIGVVPDYELLKARLAGISDDTLVANFMSTSVPTTTPEALVSEIIPRFRDCRHRWIAVVESGKLVGQIGRIDVLRLVTAGNEAEAAITSSVPSRDAAASIKAPQFARGAVRSLSGMHS